jgi:CheY-like chemotaxis protein
MARILVVDDSEMQRAQVRAQLEEAGHSVMEAGSGGDAMHAVVSAQPECMVLDLIMPGMDGFKVLASLKEQNFNLPVVVLTADVSQENLERCYRAGAKGFVPIPIDEKELLTTVKQALAI